jgi:hypothetical protein
MTVEWVAFLIRIREVTGSDFGLVTRHAPVYYSHPTSPRVNSGTVLLIRPRLLPLACFAIHISRSHSQRMAGWIVNNELGKILKGTILVKAIKRCVNENMKKKIHDRGMRNIGTILLLNIHLRVTKQQSFHNWTYILKTNRIFCDFISKHGGQY